MDSYWEVERPFQVVVKAGPEPHQVEECVFPSSIAGLKDLFRELSYAQTATKIPVKEEWTNGYYSEPSSNLVDGEIQEVKMENSTGCVDKRSIPNRSVVVDEDIITNARDTDQSSVVEGDWERSNDDDDATFEEDRATDMSESLQGEESADATTETEDDTITPISKVSTPSPGGYLKCNKCPRNFRNEEGRRLHLVMTHGMSERINCCHCPLTLKNGNALTSHMRMKHGDILANGNDTYECPGCSLIFASTSAWREHIYKKANCEGNSSKDSVQPFETQDQTEESRENPDEGPDPSFHCKKCSKNFKNSQGLKIHDLTIHRNEDVFKCCHCSASTFRNAIALSTHMRKNHADIQAAGEEKYECQKCLLIITSKADWKVHLRSKCYVAATANQCKHCGNVYKTRQSLAAHTWRSHGKGKEKYVGDEENGSTTFGCHDCSKVFNCENKYALHMKMVHTVEDSKCDQCEKSFKNRYYLNSHKWYFHGGGRERPRVEKTVFGVFQCDQCPNVYYDKRALRIHRHKKHSGKEEKKTKKIVPESERTCPICGKILQSRKSMLNHRRYGESFY